MRKLSLVTVAVFILCNTLYAQKADSTAKHSAKTDSTKQNVSSAIIQYNQGEALLDKEDYTNALPYFEAAVKLNPSFATAWSEMGLCFCRTNQPDLALEAYNKSLKINPTDITTLLGVPEVYQSQKKYNEALAAYQQIMDTYPSYPDTYYARGRLYIYYLLDYEKGLTDMCKAYNLYSTMNSPYMSDAEKEIGYIYNQMKKTGNEDKFDKILTDNHIGTSN
jgi:tetratricopeptide (TPR) repeat protein